MTNDDLDKLLYIDAVLARTEHAFKVPVDFDGYPIHHDILAEIIKSRDYIREINKSLEKKKEVKHSYKYLSDNEDVFDEENLWDGMD